MAGASRHLDEGLCINPILLHLPAQSRGTSQMLRIQSLIQEWHRGLDCFQALVVAPLVLYVQLHRFQRRRDRTVKLFIRRFRLTPASRCRSSGDRDTRPNTGSTHSERSSSIMVIHHILDTTQHVCLRMDPPDSGVVMMGGKQSGVVKLPNNSTVLVTRCSMFCQMPLADF